MQGRRNATSKVDGRRKLPGAAFGPLARLARPSGPSGSVAGAAFQTIAFGSLLWRRVKWLPATWAGSNIPFTPVAHFGGGGGQFSGASMSYYRGYHKGPSAGYGYVPYYGGYSLGMPYSPYYYGPYVGGLLCSCTGR